MLDTDRHKRHHHNAGSNWQQQQQLLQLAGLSPLHILQHLSQSHPGVSSQWLLQCRGQQTDTSRQSKAVSTAAEECDDALENYDSLRDRYASRFGTPPMFRSWDQRLKATASGLWSAVVWTAKFTVSIPGRLVGVARMSRQDWANAWDKTKKTVKEEAHHYWVTKPAAAGALILCNQHSRLMPLQ